MSTMTTQNDILQTPIEFLKGVGPKRAEVFRKEFDIHTFDDLLHYYPYRHVDKSQIFKVSDIVEDGSYIQLRGRISDVQVVGQQRGKRLTAQFTDESGTLELVWFNGIKWVQELLQKKHEFIIFGKPTLYFGHWNMTHPELIDPHAQQDSQVPMAFLPLYNTSDLAKKKTLDSKAVAKVIANLLPVVHNVIPDTHVDGRDGVVVGDFLHDGGGALHDIRLHVGDLGSGQRIDEEDVAVRQVMPNVADDAFHGTTDADRRRAIVVDGEFYENEIGLEFQHIVFKTVSA